VYIASLSKDVEVTHAIGEGRGVYAYLIEGAATFDGEEVATGDAAKVTEQAQLRIGAREASELILVDVPMRFEAVGVWKGRI
jgi:redox-sensitive bicupin YhaK (pirin superfamily)